MSVSSITNVIFQSYLSLQSIENKTRLFLLLCGNKNMLNTQLLLAVFVQSDEDMFAVDMEVNVTLNEGMRIMVDALRGGHRAGTSGVSE